MTITIDSVSDKVRQILRDEVDVNGVTDFTTDQIKGAIYEALVDISVASPLVKNVPILTNAGTKVIDVSEISDLISVEHVEYPVGERNYHDVINIGENIYELVYDSLFEKTGTSGTLTGTMDFTAGSTAVVGTGTAFKTELAVGDFIKPEKASNWYKVLRITDDENLNLELPVKFYDSEDGVTVLYRKDVALVCCNTVHRLTIDSSSLNPQEENVLVLGAVRKLLLRWINEARTRLSAASAKLTELNTAVNNMTARIDKAITDLTSGRTFIESKYTEATTAIDAVTSVINTALSDLTSGRALIGDKRTEAITALDKIATELDKSVSDLTTGRAQIDDERASAVSAIDEVNGQITQAITDIQSARTYINKINIGGSPQIDLNNTAGRELQAANNYLQEASAYLSLATTSGRYGDYAAREVQTARGYIDEARAYMSLDQVTDEHSNYAARQLQVANGYLSQARVYLDMSKPASEYGLYAARELTTATAYLNQAGGYASEINANINISRMITGLQSMIDRWSNEYNFALRGIFKRRVNQGHSRT